MNTKDAELLAVARKAAREAAELHRSQAGRVDSSRWDEKGSADFVTEVDLESERRIVRTLRRHFPAHQVLAEEGTPEDAEAGNAAADAEAGNAAADAAGEEAIRWIIDPLDGTTNWLHGYPEYAVSIAAVDARGLRVGLVLNSATGEEFSAVRGGGSLRNGEPIRASEVASLKLALVGTGFPFKRLDFLPAYLEMLGRVLRKTSGVRRGGSAALDLCDLACGRLDAFWELWLMPWDVAAGVLIVREAGGWFAPLELDRGGADAPGPDREGAGEPSPELEGAPPSAFREVAESARAFLTFCAGEASYTPFRAGAYVGGNPHLRQAFLEILR